MLSIIPPTPTPTTKMSLTLVRFLAFVTFACNVCLQSYALIFERKSISYAYAPHPYMFAGYLLGQACLQALWLLHLFVNLWDDSGSTLNPEASQLAYTPIYALGNVCLSGWAIAWLQERYEAAQWILVVNTVLQLYGMFFLKNGTLDTRKDPITVLVSKTCVAAALMFMWKTWGAIDKLSPPSITDQLYSGAVFLVLTIASGPDRNLGLCLLYVLAALYCGQYRNTGWHQTFPWISAAVVIAIVVDCVVVHRTSKVAEIDDIESGTREVERKT
ncbi:hypothetical protein CPB85DRAFT_1315570 [Mucidula mucida]|nr:hypothetical protein CPB85DRAFT_1315570 [Mucidula mucida]